MKKLIFFFAISFAGLVSANNTNPTSDNCNKNNDVNPQKIEIKSKTATSTTSDFVAKTRCYAYDSHGNLVEVPCPPIIVIED